MAGGWYHVTARGNNRAPLFRDDADRQRFLALLAELPERFSVGVHAFVLMNNHYHLILRTAEPNLSHAISWLNVSHSGWFNSRHHQVGHVFQGRFKSQVIEDIAGVCEVARYIHLNPIRLKGLQLGKSEVRRQKTAAAIDPGVALVAERLRVLAEYRWSSWRVYQGADSAPLWLDTSVIGAGCGGRGRVAQQAAVRAYTEAPVREGHLESPWARLVGGLVLGTEDFAQQLIKGRRVDPSEQTEARRLRRRVDWERVVAAAEKERGRKWSEMLALHGDWGRDGALYFAVRHGGLRLAEVLQKLPELKYAAAAQAVKRFKSALATDRPRQTFIHRMQAQLPNI